MKTLYLVSIFIHVISAVFWIGGMLFIPLILLPSIKKEPNRILMLYKTGVKLRFYGWISLSLLFLTGLLNMHFRGIPMSLEFFIDNSYGRLFTHKVALFILILAVSGIHDFRIGTKSIKEMQYTSNRKFKLLAKLTGYLNLLLALVMVFLGILISRGGF